MLVDPPVELVDIDGVDAALQPIILAPEALDRGLVLLLLGGMALAQGAAHPGDGLVGEGEPVQEMLESLCEHFLAHIGLRGISP